MDLSEVEFHEHDFPTLQRSVVEGTVTIRAGEEVLFTNRGAGAPRSDEPGSSEVLAVLLSASVLRQVPED